jgi:hypothetical protein
MFVLNKSNDWSRTLEVSNGAYTVNELTSPTQSYKLIAQSAGEVTIDNNDDETSTAAIWVKNQEQSGKVIINKIVRDAEGKTATPLDRDLFVVNLDGAEKDVSVGFKNATGYSSGEIKLPVGEYSVSEILDNRYSRIDNIDSINIEADETVTLDITNRQHEGRIKVKKIVKINGQETAPSSGDAFIVTIVDEADANNTFTATLNSANHWEETVSGIPVGDYKVTETGGGHGWEISYSTQTVKVTDGSSHEVTVTNSKTVNPDDNKPSDNTPSNNNNDNNNNNNNDNNSNNNDNNNNDNDSNDDDDNGDNDNDENGGSADTSDQIPLGLWTWLLCISGVGIIAAATLRRSRLLVTGRRRK